MMLLLTMTYGVIIAFIALYGRERGIDNVGPFFTVYALVLAFARPLSGRIADRFGYERTAAVGLAMATIGLLILSMADSLTMFLAAGFAYGFAFGMAHPSLQALVIYLVSPSRRGSATATFYTAFDLGVALGSVGGGFLSGLVALSGVYLLAAGISAIGTVCLTVYAIRRPPTAPALAR
jgi:MFS family permease